MKSVECVQRKLYELSELSDELTVVDCTYGKSIDILRLIKRNLFCLQLEHPGSFPG